MHELSREQARRIAVRAQLLAEPRPTDLFDVVRHLTMLQDDLTAAVAPSAQLVLWSRLGSTFEPEDLEAAVTSGAVIELRQRLLPAADLALHRADMAAWPGPGPLKDWQEARRNWVEANDDCRRDILELLYDEGPLPSSALPDTTAIPWESSGWNNDRNLRMMLEQLVQRGEIAAAGREGRERLWDLAERVYPDDPVVPLEEARRIRAERRLRSLGISRPLAGDIPGQPIDLAGVGEPARVEGVRGRWWVDPAYLDQEFTGRVVLLSPLDQLVFLRTRMEQLFDFDYQLEMYKPVAKRKWGYWAMPILDGDQLVGKLDATADRDAGLLRVDAVHEDGDWSPRLRKAVDAEIDDLAAWLGLKVSRSST